MNTNFSSYATGFARKGEIAKLPDALLRKQDSQQSTGAESVFFELLHSSVMKNEIQQHSGGIMDSDNGEQFRTETVADDHYESIEQQNKLNDEPANRAQENSERQLDDKLTSHEDRNDAASAAHAKTVHEENSKAGKAESESADKLQDKATRILDNVKKSKSTPLTREQGNALRDLIVEAKLLQKTLHDKPELSRKMSALIQSLESALQKGNKTQQKNTIEEELKKLILVTDGIKSENNHKAHRFIVPEKHTVKTMPDKAAALTEQNSTKLELFKNEAGNNTTNQESQNDFSFSRNTGVRENSTTIHAQVRNDAKLLFRDQLESVISNAKVTVQDAKNASLTLRMYPEKLGNVTVNLGLENGTLTGRFLVDSVEAKDALLGALNDVRTLLENEGISLGSFHVNVRDQHREHQAQQALPVNTLSALQEMEIVDEYSSMQKMAHEGVLDLVG